jgi:hypothetical protein
MNINKYKAIDYSDNEPHTATAAEHIASIAQELREFCATNTDAEDYATAGDYIRELGETLEALYERNRGDILTLTFADWSGYIIKDEEE